VLGEKASLAPARPATLRSTTEFSLDRFFFEIRTTTSQ
jgi:hypothetical protein